MTKFVNRSFSVGPKPGEKITDTEWEIAVGLRCPTCKAHYGRGGTTKCSNPACADAVLENPLDEAAPVDVTEYVARARAERSAIGYFDGGSSSNPGLGASAWALEYDDGTTMTGMKPLGVVTNNEAEYVGLIDLLLYALDHGVKRIRVYGDSQLIVNQTLGKWKVKDADLTPLAEEAKRLAAQFEEFQLVWIPREENTKCDALVKQTIKEQK